MNNVFRSTTALQNGLLGSNASTLKQATLMLFGVLLLAFSAQLSIPLTPVPLTFQSATVVLIGMMFGAKRGTGIVAAYLIAGACGLPMFASASAVTGGYLLGFLPAAFVSGFLAERGFAKNYLSSFLVACLSATIIFACGVSVLSTFIGWHQAFIVGVLPFIVSEPIKLLAVAYAARTCWK